MRTFISVIVVFIHTHALASGFDIGTQIGTGTKHVQQCEAKCGAQEQCMQTCIETQPEPEPVRPLDYLRDICNRHAEVVKEALCSD